MKKTTIVLTALLALAPVLVSAQQPPQPPKPPQAPQAQAPQQPVPPLARGQRLRQGLALRAWQLRRAPFAGRAWQGWMGGPGQGFGFLRGQGWGPMQQFRAQALRGRMLGRGMGPMMGMPGPGMGMQGPGMGMQGPGRGMQGPGRGMRGQAGPLGPLANPRIREQLNLTDAQVKQLDELRASVQAQRQKQMEQVRGERQKLMDQVRAERQKERQQDQADRQKLMQELRASNQKLMEQRQQEQQQMHQKLLQLLTPEQRTKLEQLEAAPPQGRGMGPGMGPGMGMRRGTVRPDTAR